MPGEDNVTITLRRDQAVAIGRWLGEHRVVDLPDEACEAIYAITHAFLRGPSSCDVTTIASKLVGDDAEAQHLTILKKEKKK